MLSYLNRHVVQPLWAAKDRSRHLEYYRHLRWTQFDSPDVIRARQLVMLKAQLRHAYETVPYYRAAWDRAGVHPADVRSLADLDAFPVLTKANIRRHEQKLLSTAYDPATLRVKRTSGSTGVPLTICCDEPAVQWKAACTLRADEWSGWRLGQRVAKVWGNPEYRHFGLKGRIRNAVLDRAVYLDTLDLTDARIAAFGRQLRRQRPGLIFGHAHSVYLLACTLKKARIDDVRPSGVICTAMPLHDWQRRVIEAVFGCPATDRYGCEEVSLIASECERHRGLHVNSDSVYTESSPLLVTDLVNRAMPLIRYQVGDVATPATETCPCGRGLPTLAKVQGREADFVVTPAGTLISGISLTENFALLIPGTAQVQVIQESLHLLRVRLVTDGPFTAADHARVAGLVAATFGPGVRHEVERVDAIPQEASGKYRFCVSKVARERLEAMSA